MSQFSARKSHEAKKTCERCGESFQVVHWSQGDKRFCSRDCASKGSISLLHIQSITMYARRPGAALHPMTIREIQIRRQFPELMGALEAAGHDMAFHHRVGQRCFGIALESQKILIDVDGRFRRPGNHVWRLAYRLAWAAGWEILNDQEALARFTAPRAPQEATG